jgi:BMFP domain-containing protein YqiC
MDDRRTTGGVRPDSADSGGNTAADGLVSSAARNLTTLLSFGRKTAATAVEEATGRAGRLLGAVRDVGGDLASYADPGPWLEELYALLGIASSETVTDMDERVDEVIMKVDDVARQRAREELMLLQQRIGELEMVLDDLNKTQARTVMSNVLGRLSQLEARIDMLPMIDTRDSRRLAT